MDTGQICGVRALAPRPSSDLDPFCGAPRCSADPRLGRKPQQWWGGRTGRVAGVTFRSNRPEGAESPFFEEGGDFAQSPIWQGGAQFSEKYPVRVAAPNYLFFAKLYAPWPGPAFAPGLAGSEVLYCLFQIDKLGGRVSKSTGPPVPSSSWPSESTRSVVTGTPSPHGHQAEPRCHVTLAG